uniref:Uncharacterized protein n=1 Tax=Setaria digitata TaxID=48799 RepID=A0A915PQZ7_9BILA
MNRSRVPQQQWQQRKEAQTECETLWVRTLFTTAPAACQVRDITRSWSDFCPFTDCMVFISHNFTFRHSFIDHRKFVGIKMDENANVFEMITSSYLHLLSMESKSALEQKWLSPSAIKVVEPNWPMD